MSKSFVYDRFDAETYTDKWGTIVIPVAASDGVYVMADDAINREAVLQARIRTLETQLKDARQGAAHWKIGYMHPDAYRRLVGGAPSTCRQKSYGEPAEVAIYAAIKEGD